MKVTNNQIKELTDKGYSIASGGRHLVLFSADFHHKAWDEVCQSLQIEFATEEVVVAYIGVKIEKENQ